MKFSYEQLPIDPAMTALFRRSAAARLTPTAAKLLDMLTLELASLTLPEAEAGRASVSLDDYTRICGYSSPEAALKQLRKDIQLLSSVSLPGEDGSPLLAAQRISGGSLTVTFSRPLARRLLHCPRTAFPIALLSIDAKKQNAYFLGRRLAEFGQASCTAEVGTLLEACPYIPSEEYFEGSRSILKRKVVDPFTSSLEALKNAGIITWRSIGLNDTSYQAFTDSTVDFSLPGHPHQLHWTAETSKRAKIHFDPTPLLKEGEILTKTITF